MKLNHNTNHRKIALIGSAMAIMSVAAIGPSAKAQTPGSITVRTTSPIAVSGTSAAPGLSCVVRTTAITYNVRITKTTVDGYVVNANGTVTGYAGPGLYNATMSVTVSGNGKNLAGGGKKVPVTITESGGTASFSKTTSGTARTSGKTITGDLSWTCPIA